MDVDALEDVRVLRAYSRRLRQRSSGLRARAASLRTQSVALRVSMKDGTSRRTRPDDGEGAAALAVPASHAGVASAGV